MKKGDIVQVKATVRTGYGMGDPGECAMVFIGTGEDDRNLFRRKADFMAVVVGKSCRETGRRVDGRHYGPEWEPAYLSKAKRHPVWMVERLKNERYFKPVACLEADLEVIQEVTPPTHNQGASPKAQHD